MNKLSNIQWQLIFDKVGTVLVDRRFWQLFVIPTAVAVGLFPYLTPDNTSVMSEQAVKISELVVAATVPILSSWLVGTSWTKREPSGLKYKEPKPETDVLAEAVIKALKDV